MITEADIKQVEGIKCILNEKLHSSEVFNWDIANKIECLDRLVRNLRIAPNSYKLCSPESKFNTTECIECGWYGSSELLDGGGQIADTGDYDDCYCPVCGNSDLNDKDTE